jgi:hypothetical protein
LAHVVSSLAYPNLLGTKRLGCCCLLLIHVTVYQPYIAVKGFVVKLC